MAILNTLIASSAVALTILAQAATPVNALAAPAHGNHARHAVSPNHNGMIKRKRNTHKNRKRCIASQQNLGSTDTSNNNNGNNTPSSSQGSSDSTYTPPATNNNNSGNNNNQASAPACGGGKMGLAWDWQLSNDFIPNAVSGKTCWLYNWSPSPPSQAQLSGLKFVPMYWGPGSDHAESFSSNVLYSDTNYGLALAMNEVNEPSQSNLDVWTGASLWRQYLLPLRQKGYYIISPSTTSAPTGITWMQNWLAQLGGDELPNALALHWYGTSFNDFTGYVSSFHNAFPGYKLWITEFACTDFSGQNIWCDVPSFAAQAEAWINSQDYIEAAFPFGLVTSMVGVQEENRLMNWDGSLTGVGNEYLH
jgi:hypothetical protein